MNKGQVPMGILISGITIITGVFGWTYAQFNSVNTHAAQTDIEVATIKQKSVDIDSRLSRIEDKLDQALSNKKELTR